MNNRTTLYIWVSAVLLVAGCPTEVDADDAGVGTEPRDAGPGDGGQPDAGLVVIDAGNALTLAGDALPIFLAHCAECHRGPSSALDFESATLHATLLEATPQLPCFDGAESLERPYVVAGSPDESLVWIKASDLDFSLECGREMPPLGEGPLLSSAPEEAEVIRRWIEDGALP